ncbi:hypothetical protein TNCV_4385401 [Trichonephila clavipes]|nr:hypothetical protein TNCV_4385401 [Trichonephila clavipes]
MGLAISNHSQVSRMTSELISLSPNFRITPGEDLEPRHTEHTSAPLHGRSLVTQDVLRHGPTGPRASAPMGTSSRSLLSLDKIMIRIISNVFSVCILRKTGNFIQYVN